MRPITLTTPCAATGKATIAIRPERITLSSAQDPTPHGLGQARGEVLLSSYMGAVVEHVVMLDPQTQIIARGPSGATPRFPAGTRVALTWPQSSECLFDAANHPVTVTQSAPNERIATNA